MDKDEPLDRLLERTSRARGDARPQGACLDAETLAAWSDGSLTAQERAAAEVHAADCDRCLSVLAATARTAPPPSMTLASRWVSVRWLVPLTTAAVAMAAWILVQPPEQEAPPPVPAPPTTATIDAVKPAEPVVPSNPESSARTRSEAFDKKVASSPAPQTLKDQAESRRSAWPLAKDSSVADERLGATTETAVPEAEARLAPPPPPPAAASPPPSMLPRAAEAGAGFRSVARESIQQSRVVVSPDPNVQWRVAGTTVERSIDGGRTWRTQSTGTSVDLLAGSSPAPAVCWIVGRSGVVLLSTDGDTWRRLAFPDTTVDLAAVSARDSVTADVTAADGRVYHTSDGGRTWTPQENPATPF